MASIAALPTLDDVLAAARAIEGRVHVTPSFSSATLSERAGAPVWLKAELFQRVGAFKPRGAFNRMRALSAEERERGVIAISAGNHAQALAVAARDLGVDALILMPADASPPKVAATRGYGAQVDLESADSVEALRRMREIAEATGRVIIHPYDDAMVIAGQGTVGLELVDQVPELDVVIVPIGGGGLISGIATAVKELRPHVRMIGVEPELASAMHDALEQGGPVSMVPGPTIADALKAPIAGELCHEICSRLVDEVVLVDEDAIAEATRFLYQRAKLAAEAGGAVGVAALLSGRLDVSGANGVAVVISGGNISGELSASVLDPR
jgi:threonine dehydratase